MAIAAVDEAGKAPSRYALEYVAVYVYRFNEHGKVNRLDHRSAHEALEDIWRRNPIDMADWRKSWPSGRVPIWCGLLKPK